MRKSQIYLALDVIVRVLLVNFSEIFFLVARCHSRVLQRLLLSLKKVVTTVNLTALGLTQLALVVHVASGLRDQLKVFFLVKYPFYLMFTALHHCRDSTR